MMLPAMTMVDGELTQVWDIPNDVITKNVKRGILRLEFAHVEIIRSPMEEKPSLIGAISLALPGHFVAPVLR